MSDYDTAEDRLPLNVVSEPLQTLYCIIYASCTEFDFKCRIATVPEFDDGINLIAGDIIPEMV